MSSRTCTNISAPVVVLHPLERAVAIKGVIAGAVMTQPMNMVGVMACTSMGLGSISRMPTGVALIATSKPVGLELPP